MTATIDPTRFDVVQRGDALDLLQSLPDCSAAVVVFDPQHHSIIDHLKFGNEGARQIGRAALPAMTRSLIKALPMELPL